jgi:hypothetical protein
MVVFKPQSDYERLQLLLTRHLRSGLFDVLVDVREKVFEASRERL